MTVQFINIHLVCIALLSACTPLPADKKPVQGSASPPMVQEVANESPSLITLKFDKEVSADADNFMIVPEKGITSVECKGHLVEIHPSQELDAGEKGEYELPECDEGELAWVPAEQLLDLPMWEGDRAFVGELLRGTKEISFRLDYEGESCAISSI